MIPSDRFNPPFWTIFAKFGQETSRSNRRKWQNKFSSRKWALRIVTRNNRSVIPEHILKVSLMFFLRLLKYQVGIQTLKAPKFGKKCPSSENIVTNKHLSLNSFSENFIIKIHILSLSLFPWTSYDYAESELKRGGFRAGFFGIRNPGKNHTALDIFEYLYFYSFFHFRHLLKSHFLDLGLLAENIISLVLKFPLTWIFRW